MAEAKIKITAETQQAERAIAGLDKSLEDLKNQGADVAKALGVITAAATAMGYAILKTLDSAGQLVDAADSLGVSAANLYKLHQAALLAGVGTDTLNMSLQRLSVNLAEGLQKGTGPVVDAMQRLGIPLQEIINLRPDEQFKVISERLLEIENPAQRAAAAVDLFGKQGPAILRVAENMAKVAALKDSLGLGLNDRDIQALDQAGEALDELKIIWEAGIKQAVVEIAPYIIAFVEKIKEAVKEAGGFEGVWQRIKSVLNTALNIMLGIATVLAIRMVAGAAAFAVQLGRALIAARGISLVLSRTPIGLIAAGIAIAADKLGIDLVGAGKEFLDLNLDIEGAQTRINTAYDEQQTKLNQSTQAAVGLNDEQKKALKTLDDTILKLETSARYEREKLQYGEVESRIRKTIAEENDKLAKVGLKLNDLQKERLANAIKEEEAAKRIKSATEGLVDAQLKFAAPAYKEFAAAAKELKDGAKAIEEAYATGNKELIDIEEARVTQLRRNYKETVVRYGESLSERNRLDREYKTNLENLEAAMLANKAINAGIETDLYRQLEEEKLKLAQQYEQKKLDMQLQNIQLRLEKERGAMAATISDQERAVLQQAGQQERQRAIVQERIAFEKKSETEKAQWAISQGAQMFTALGAHNKRAFEAAKAFNIANAIMNTYMAATKALATYPWPFGLIGMAAAIGTGLAQVAQIRAQTYSGRALGGPVMGNQSYIVGENGPELFTPNTTGSITRNSDLEGMGKTVNVNFTIVANDTTGFDQLLASRRGMITQIINDAVLEKGRRSIA